MKKTEQPHTAGKADSIELVQDVTRQTHRQGQNPELVKYIIKYVQISGMGDDETCNKIGKM